MGSAVHAVFHTALSISDICFLGFSASGKRKTWHLSKPFAYRLSYLQVRKPAALSYWRPRKAWQDSCETICALLTTPIHYSSHACCPCNVTLWFLGIYVSALVWLGCGSHPWPTPWAMLSRIGCHGTFHVTSNLPSSIQWLKCRWYIMKKENGTSNQEHASGLEMMSHEGDWVGSHLPPTVRNQVWLVFAAILFRSGQSAANWNRNSLNYRVKVIVFGERIGSKLGISKIMGPVSLVLQPRQLTAACPAKHSVNPH